MGLQGTMTNLLYNNYASLQPIRKVDVDPTFLQLADQGLDIGISIFTWLLVPEANGIDRIPVSAARKVFRHQGVPDIAVEEKEVVDCPDSY